MLNGASATTPNIAANQSIVQPGDWLFADADDYHPAANVEKMRSGQALNDQDRAPWLQSLNSLLCERAQNGQGTVLACSALKERYRLALASNITPHTRFVFLDGSFELINERMQARKNHYMPASLLRSQFAALEPPEQAIKIDINQTLPSIIAQIISALSKT